MVTQLNGVAVGILFCIGAMPRLLECVISLASKKIEEKK
nr:MAG TPA: hypothetical protein [Caudoviricetes sp.]